MEVAIPERVQCPSCFALFRGAYMCCPRDGAALAPAIDDPMIGTTFAERYVVEELLGEGAMGRVYRARHARMSRKFAIKVLFGDCSIDAKVCARFAREAESASRLRHANVIGVIDFGETAEGLLFLAMDLADGPDLATIIAGHGPLPAPRVIDLMLQISEGLSHAHSRGLVHRDLKPDNVIIERDEQGGDLARIGDFGIAVVAADGQEGRLTTAGLVLGTPHYMAPEQATGDSVDERTDLFALGIMLYEMLAGTLPFDGTGIEVARKNLSCDPPAIADRVPGLQVDPRLEALAFKLMEKRPSARPQTAREVVDLLRAIAEGRVPGRAAPTAPATMPLDVPKLPSQATPLEDLDDATPPAGRKRWMIVVAAIAALALGVVGVLVLRGDPEPRQASAAVTPDAAIVAVLPAPLDAAAAPAPLIAEVAVDAGVAEPPVEPVAKASVPGVSRKPSDKTDRTAKKPGGDKPGSGTAAVETPPVETPPVKPPILDEQPSLDSLTKQYKALGAAVDELVRLRDDDIGQALKRRYLAIPFTDAVRKPELRRDALAKIAALRRDVARSQP